MALFGTHWNPGWRLQRIGELMYMQSEQERLINSRKTLQRTCGKRTIPTMKRSVVSLVARPRDYRVGRLQQHASGSGNADHRQGGPSHSRSEAVRPLRRSWPLSIIRTGFEVKAGQIKRMWTRSRGKKLRRRCGGDLSRRRLSSWVKVVASTLRATRRGGDSDCWQDTASMSRRRRRSSRARTWMIPQVCYRYSSLLSIEVYCNIHHKMLYSLSVLIGVSELLFPLTSLSMPCLRSASGKRLKLGLASTFSHEKSSILSQLFNGSAVAGMC